MSSTHSDSNSKATDTLSPEKKERVEDSVGETYPCVQPVIALVVVPTATDPLLPKKRYNGEVASDDPFLYPCLMCCALLVSIVLAMIVMAIPRLVHGNS
jgi:hypothetical protein